MTLKGKISSAEIAGLAFLERNFCPVVGDARGQHLRGELLHLRDCFAGTVARRRVALDFGRRVEIVSHQAVGTRGVAHRQHRAERHHARRSCFAPAAAAMSSGSSR